MRGARAGVTVLETILAISILAVVISAVFTLFPSSILASHRAEARLQADALASTLLERQRTVDFLTLVVGSTVPLGAVVTREGVELRPVLVVKSVPDSDEARLKELEVTVSWTTRNVTRSVTHSVLVAHVRR